MWGVGGLGDTAFRHFDRAESEWLCTPDKRDTDNKPMKKMIEALLNK